MKYNNKAINCYNIPLFHVPSFASNTGIACVFDVRVKRNIFYRNHTDLEKTFSFTWRELEAIQFSLLSSIKQFENKCLLIRLVKRSKSQKRYMLFCICWAFFRIIDHIKLSECGITQQVSFISDIRIYIHRKNTIFNNRNKHRNKNNCSSSYQKWAKVFSNVRG